MSRRRWPRHAWIAVGVIAIATGWILTMELDRNTELMIRVEPRPRTQAGRDRIARILRESVDPRVRARAATVLGESDGEGVTRDALSGALADDDARVRDAAANALARLDAHDDAFE